jgi:hypothetical protein
MAAAATSRSAMRSSDSPRRLTAGHRALLGPVAAVAVIACLAAGGTVALAVQGGAGPMVLAWLLLGVTAGYALSGSA